MNVLLSSYVRWWNAEAAYTAALAEQLLTEGHKAWVLTSPGTRNEGELSRRNIPLITHIPSAQAAPWHWPGAIQQLRDFAQKEKIDVVNVFRSQEHPLHVLAGRGLKSPALVRTRGTDRAIRPGWFNTKLHRDWSDGHIASAAIVRDRMVAGLGLQPTDIDVIYYPVDSAGIEEETPASRVKKRKAAKKALLAELGFQGQPLVLAVVGRLYPEKGHRVLLEALDVLQKGHPDVALVILAKNAPGEDPERPDLEAMVQQKGMADKVRFLNFREDVRTLMQGVDIGVVPSLASEVNCRVVVEFFSVGTPVVAFPTGALPEVVEHKKSGLVTVDHSAVSLAAALEEMMTQPNTRDKLGEGAWFAAKNRFARQSFLAQTLKVYEKAIKARQARLAK